MNKLTSREQPDCPLASHGFLKIDAHALAAQVSASPTLIVLLQSDINKHPEVADSWVIVPEILKKFPPDSWTAVFADVAQSELIAREYRVLKFPALLFFRQHRYAGSLVGLHPWQEYLERVTHFLTAPLRLADIPVVVK